MGTPGMSSLAREDAMESTLDSESRSTLQRRWDSTRTFPRGIQPAAMARWSTPSTPSAASLCCCCCCCCCLPSFLPSSAVLDSSSRFFSDFDFDSRSFVFDSAVFDSAAFSVFSSSLGSGCFSLASVTALSSLGCSSPVMAGTGVPSPHRASATAGFPSLTPTAAARIRPPPKAPATGGWLQRRVRRSSA